MRSTELILSASINTSAPLRVSLCVLKLACAGCKLMVAASLITALLLPLRVVDIFTVIGRKSNH